MTALDLLNGPFLGVGLGIDVHSQAPDWHALIKKNGKGKSRAFDYFEVYTRGEAGLAKQVKDAAKGLPLIYHHEGLDPVYPKPPLEKAVEACDENMRALAAPWCVEELAYRRLDGRYLDFFMPALLTDESLRTAVANIRMLNDSLPAPVIPENAPYQLPVGEMHILDYMKLLSERAEVPLVLDLGHLYSFQLCRGNQPLDGTATFPFDRVLELHVAGAEILNRDNVLLYEDIHGAGAIPDAVLKMLADVLPLCANVRAVTIEVEDATAEQALAQAAQVKKIVDKVKGGASRGLKTAGSASGRRG